MSLKSFHIVFISLSAILAGGSAVYAVTSVGGAMGYAWAAVAAASAIGLILYGRRFLANMKKLEATG
ncbi:MAG: hypothetical protein ACI9W4_001377 [Rhodothermales bacterium]|jgi:hypothetical protein